MQIVEKILKKFDNKESTNTSGTITNGVAHKITDISLFGNTFQQTYTGKNLFDKNTMGTRYYRYIDQYSYWLTAQDSYSVIIPCEPNKTYTISHSYTESTIFRCAFIKETTIPETGNVECFNSYRGTTDLSHTITTGEGATYLIFQGSASVMSTIIESLQVEEGSTATSYEPYVGGIPSPNPDYPQTIQNVSGEVEVKVANGTDSSASGYEEQTVTLHLPESFELCKIGTYQDSIIKQNGKWYKQKYIGKIIFDGSEDEGLEIYNSTSSRIAVQTNDIEDVKPYAKNNNAPELFCSHYTPVSGNTTWKQGQISRLTGNKLKLFFIIDTSYTLETFKTWLSSNNVTVYYVLNEPVLEEITDNNLKTQLDSLLNLSTYEGTTYITVTSESQIPEISVSYYTRFIKRYIRNLWYLNHLQNIYK